MTAYDAVVHGLSEAFDLSPSTLRSSPVLAGLVARALEALNSDEVVARLVARGSIAGASSPYGVVVARVRQLLAGLDEEAHIAAVAEAERRAAAEARTRRRAAVLASLVAAGDLPLDAAEAEIGHALRGDLAATAAALAELRRYLAAMAEEVRK